MSRSLRVKRIGAVAWAAAAARPLAPGVASAQAGSAAATLTSADGGVTITVTPKAIAAAGGLWEFSVVPDTHSTDLSDGLLRIASLTRDDGRSVKPVGWSGAPSGGHHRRGVLAFEPPTPPPAAIEPTIARPGEAAARVLHRQLPQPEHVRPRQAVRRQRPADPARNSGLWSEFLDLAIMARCMLRPTNPPA